MIVRLLARARRPLSVIVAAAAGALSAPAAASAEVTATPLRISETRTQELAEVKEDDPFSSGFFGNSLTLTVRVDGEEVKGATHYGNLKITEAEDDTGKSLLPKEDEGGFGFITAGAGGFTPINRFNFGPEPEEGQAAPTHSDIDLRLEPAARDAKKIATLKGELQIKAGGEAKSVTVPAVSKLVGKPVKDETLEEAGLTVTVEKLDVFESQNGVPPEPSVLTLKIEGDAGQIQSVTVADAKGESVSAWSASSGSGEGAEAETTYSVGFDAQPDRVSLKIDLIIGQQTVTVPLDFKDVPLP